MERKELLPIAVWTLASIACRTMYQAKPGIDARTMAGRKASLSDPTAARNSELFLSRTMPGDPNVLRQELLELVMAAHFH